MTPNNSERDMQSLFITFNTHGIPERMAHLIWSKNDPCVPDNLFLKYVKDEAILAQQGNMLPDNSVCRYDFAGGEFSEGQIHEFARDGIKLKGFISEKGLTPSNDISLRTAATVNLLSGDVGTLDALTGLKNSALKDHPFQTIVNQMTVDFMNFDIFNTWNELIGVVHTDQGALPFPDTGRGKTCCRAYLQYLADNFFRPEVIHTTAIGLSVIEKASLNIKVKADETVQMFSLVNDSFLPEKAHYAQLENKPKMIYNVELEIQPFKNFIQDYNLEQSTRNRDICALLSISKNGFMEPDSLKSFSHIEDFKALAEQESQMPNDKLQAKHQALASSILHEKYGLDLETDHLRKDNTQKPITPKHPKL